MFRQVEETKKNGQIWIWRIWSSSIAKPGAVSNTLRRCQIFNTRITQRPDLSASVLQIENQKVIHPVHEIQHAKSRRQW